MPIGLGVESVTVTAAENTVVVGQCHFRAASAHRNRVVAVA